MMEKREGYKKTEIGWLPEEWDVKSLQSLIDKNIILKHIDGNHGSLYPRSSEFVEEGIPYIGANSILNSKIDIGRAKYLSEERASLFKKGVAYNGDVLFASNATVGPVAVLDLPYEYTILSTTITLYRCDTIHLNNYYLLFYLASPFFEKQYLPIIRQTTRNQLPITTQRKLAIIVPPPPEQKKIASILTTVDDKISSIDQQIQQTEQLKKGLMEKLLTEGIGHTEFKETKIGRIPKGWKVISVGEIVEKIIGGGTPSRERPDYYNGTIPWITVKDLSDSSFYKNSAIETISEEGLKDSSANLIVSDSIIISTRMGLGRGFINTVAMAINQDMKALYLKRDNISNTFFLYWYFSKSAFIETLGTGTTVKGISLTTLKKLALPLPPIEEQKQIASILSTVDDKIDILTQKKTHYQTLKKGLSQQLLTGQMRVKI